MSLGTSKVLILETASLEARHLWSKLLSRINTWSFSLFTQLCKDVFWNDTDIDVAAYIANAVETTNKNYGGRDNYQVR